MNGDITTYLLLNIMPSVITGIVASYYTANLFASRVITHSEFDKIVRRLDEIEARINKDSSY